MTTYLFPARSYLSHNVPWLIKKQKSSFEPHSYRRLQRLSIWTSLKFCPLVKVNFTKKKSGLYQIESICRQQNNSHTMSSVFDRVENIVRKGENAGYKHCLIFPQCFQKASFTESSKTDSIFRWLCNVSQSTLYQMTKFWTCPNWKNLQTTK